MARGYDPKAMNRLNMPGKSGPHGWAIPIALREATRGGYGPVVARLNHDNVPTGPLCECCGINRIAAMWNGQR